MVFRTARDGRSDLSAAGGSSFRVFNRPMILPDIWNLVELVSLDKAPPAIALRSEYEESKRAYDRNNW